MTDTNHYKFKNIFKKGVGVVVITDCELFLIFCVIEVFNNVFIQYKKIKKKK